MFGISPSMVKCGKRLSSPQKGVVLRIACGSASHRHSLSSLGSTLHSATGPLCQLVMGKGKLSTNSLACGRAGGSQTPFCCPPRCLSQFPLRGCMHGVTHVVSLFLALCLTPQIRGHSFDAPHHMGVRASLNVFGTINRQLYSSVFGFSFSQPYAFSICNLMCPCHTLPCMLRQNRNIIPQRSMSHYAHSFGLTAHGSPLRGVHGAVISSFLLYECFE